MNEESATCKLAVGRFSTEKTAGYAPAEIQTRHIRFSSNPFAWGDAALESAIEVASLEVRIARNEPEHESAMYWLEQLRAQREVRS